MFCGYVLVPKFFSSAFQTGLAVYDIRQISKTASMEIAAMQVPISIRAEGRTKMKRPLNLDNTW